MAHPRPSRGPFGVTLVEMVGALAIIAILAAAIAGLSLNSIYRARVARAQADLSAIRQGILDLIRDTGIAPFGRQLLPGCVGGEPAYYDKDQLNSPKGGLIRADPVDFPTWKGPYIPVAVGDDPWGKSYELDYCYPLGPDSDMKSTTEMAVALVAPGHDAMHQTPDDVRVYLTAMGRRDAHWTKGAAPLAPGGAAEADPCVGVECKSPPGQCYLDQGTCSAGTCTYDAKPTGTPCNDGDACTHTDGCNAGACSGTKITCTSDLCTSRTCNGTASCTVTYNNGTPCSDGNLCTHSDGCLNGACQGAWVACNSDVCTTRTCNGTSSCAITYTTNSCDDVKPCTFGDRCSGGTCAGTAIACPSDVCTTRTCNGTATCSIAYTTSPCDDGNPCTLADRCNAGTCRGVAFACNSPPGRCYLPNGTCVGGTCNYPPRGRGARCDDQDACTHSDTCDGMCNHFR